MKSLYLYKSLEWDYIITEYYKSKAGEESDFLSGLFDFGRTFGMRGNLWKLYLTFLIVNDENPYSLSCEGKDPGEDSLSETAKLDISYLLELYNEDFSFFTDESDRRALELAKDFSCSNSHLHMLSKRIREEITKLSEEIAASSGVDEAEPFIRRFYSRFGVGDIGLHRAFRLDEEGELIPVTNISHVSFDDLVGYDFQKKQLRDNTEQFLKGRPSNNVLLYGDAGTGKSTSIKAMMGEYYEDGLRVIEVYKHQFKHLNALISQIKNRRYRFIIFMDDLSFEEFEIEYKYLKAVIEGGLEKKPENVLIYATSNRRHLVKESFKDKGEILDDDLHKNDTVQEKLSLAYRFGVQIYFPSPEKREFNNIVLELAKKEGLDMDEQTLLLEANKWELRGSGKSGRSARQLIDNLLGKTGE